MNEMPKIDWEEHRRKHPEFYPPRTHSDACKASCPSPSTCRCICHPEPNSKPEHEIRCYRIIRFRRNGRPRTIRNNVTLSIAQLHCNDPRTRKAGVWFDGYDYMPGCRPKES